MIEDFGTILGPGFSATLLDNVLPGIGWGKHAEDMKADAERYRDLSDEDKEIEALVEVTGWPVERARWLYKNQPGFAKFFIPPHP